MVHGAIRNETIILNHEDLWFRTPKPRQPDVADALIEKMAFFGRHLLISSSRPGGLPANLQGVWNGDCQPAWSSDYHIDENIQMNYGQALPGNLAETARPFFDYYESMIVDNRRNAQALFGCRGIVAPTQSCARWMRGR